jgi:hypothetical protein
MSTKMGPTPTQSATVSGLPFYVWEVAGKPITIRLYFDAIDRMSPEVLRGLGALKRRGAEVGGLLLGISEPGFPQRVTIQDFEPVPSEYLTGPSYNLSQNDLVALEAAIARRQSDPEGGLSVVGFYRSHTRDELFMDEADLALAHSHFPGEGNVFLLIKPFATRTSIGGFFFWEDGEISRQSSYLEFPFHRTELGGGAPRPAPSPPRPDAHRPDGERPLPPYTPARELGAQPAGAEEDPWPALRNSTLSILSAPPEEVSRLPGWKWLMVPAFLALTGVAGYFGYQNLSGVKKPAVLAGVETALPLKLSVTEKQDQIDVAWDRTAPAIALAKRGVLSISDGANRRDLELSGAQLRNGRVLYSRLSGDVGLRLEVFPEGQESVSESIRIVSAEPARQPTPAELAPEQAPAAKPVTSDPVEPPKPVEAPKKIAARPAPRVPVKAAAPSIPVRPPAPRTVDAAPKPPEAQPEPEPEVELQRPTRRQ